MAQALENIELEVGRFLEEELQVLPADRILVAVSGGKDSMCLLHLLHRLGFAVEVAHVNYQLRGESSDLDEELVKDFCGRSRIVFHCQRFDTEAIASEAGQSIQECARELRYTWFATLREQQGLKWIATAHHLQDSLETFLINLSRGTGLKGLLGIPAKREKIIRPFSKVTPADLLRYREAFSIPFRTDASNSKTNYTRNKIRLELLPLLNELPGNLLSAFKQTQSNLQQHFDFSQPLLSDLINKYVEKKGTQILLHIDSIKKIANAQLALYQFLSAYEFSQSNIQDMQSCKEGARFESSTYEACLRNGIIYLQKKEISSREDSFVIEQKNGRMTLAGGELFWEKKTLHDEAYKSADSHSAFLNIEALQWPLQIRKWKAGDRFQPFGLSGKSKLVSDYFADKKLNAFEKEAIWILCSGAQICWIIGERIAEPFKLSENQEKCLALQWKPSNSASASNHH